jgi:hypothetical protein
MGKHTLPEPETVVISGEWTDEEMEEFSQGRK